MIELSSGHLWTMTLYSVSMTSLLVSSCRWFSVLTSSHGFLLFCSDSISVRKTSKCVTLADICGGGVCALGEVSAISCRLGRIDIAAVSSASFVNGLEPFFIMVSRGLWYDSCGLQCPTCHRNTGQTSENSRISLGTPFLSGSNAVLSDSCWKIWR